MNNNVTNGQVGINVYTYLMQVQSAYSRFLQIKTQIRLFDNNLKVACEKFDLIPNSQNLGEAQNVWNQRFGLMQQLPSLADNIVENLIDATKIALSSMQMNIMSNNQLGVVVSDNSIASICNFVEQNSSQLTLLPYYRQQCINNGILIQISDMEIRIQLSKIVTPNFNRLKKLIRGF